MTPFRRVAILWIIVLAVFAAFAAVWQPVHHYQVLHDPANFIALAESLEATDPARARAALQTGITRFRPPVARPYARLAAQGERGPVAHLAEFYTALQAPPSSRIEAIANAGRNAFDAVVLPAPSKDAQQYMNTCFATLGRNLRFGDAADDFTFRQKAGLLWLTGGGGIAMGEIGTTGVQCPVDIFVFSAGGTGGTQGAHLLLRGRDYAKHRRGLHAAIIDPLIGQVVQLGTFDLWDDLEEAMRMLEFLDGAPAGSIGAFTVSDDASLNMTPALETALAGFGLERQAWVDRTPRFFGLRYSFAAIGVKGAAEGTALQAWSPAEFELDGRRYPGHPVVVGILAREDSTP